MGKGRINNDDNSGLLREGGWWENSGPPVLFEAPQGLVYSGSSRPSKQSSDARDGLDLEFWR